MSEHHTNHSNDKRLWLGVILVAIGGVWLLDNLNIIPYYIPHYFFSWKTFLIVLGLYFTLGRNRSEAGIIMIAVGTIFLLQDIGLFYVRNIWHIFWPAIIIVIGISLIMRRSGFGREHSSDEKKNSLDYIDDFAIIGGRDRKVDSQNFKGGKITAMFGGSEIDLRGAQLAEGVNVIDLFVVFGGSVIIVPPDWNVKVEVTSILGGFSDKRSSALKVVPNSDKVLVVKGFVMFGGGEVKYKV
ncbi:hypothetical protein C900_04548 [Fulvivirga imtechensis AK7]|uniref:Cell wall-active antibiotics response LiaF-like C-terminal domain-containing protein n=1 Tax=Fulvivirga imtechensis AK7 TaxID=1237149 RepID=L8JM14_9BACT|nr:DUF5668 domain-containing protein [Fulvivirga imtechensis]ELR69845.1 hypothetical protein C900_04548 [Fulvivirga imtechensis AK7]